MRFLAPPCTYLFLLGRNKIALFELTHLFFLSNLGLKCITFPDASLLPCHKFNSIKNHVIVVLSPLPPPLFFLIPP